MDKVIGFLQMRIINKVFIIYFMYMNGLIIYELILKEKPMIILKPLSNVCITYMYDVVQHTV